MEYDLEEPKMTHKEGNKCKPTKKAEKPWGRMGFSFPFRTHISSCERCLGEKKNTANIANMFQFERGTCKEPQFPGNRFVLRRRPLCGPKSLMMQPQYLSDKEHAA